MATLPPLPPGAVLMENPAGQLPPLPPGAELVQEAKKKGMDIFPQWLQDAGKYGPGFLREKGNDFKRGALETLAGMGEGAGNLAGEGMRSPGVTNSPTPQQEVRAAYPKNPDETSRESLFTRFTEGAGGGAAMPLGGGLGGIAKQAFAAGMGGVSGELGRRGAEHFAPESPMLQNAADLGMGMFGGGLFGWGSGPKQSVAQQEIRKATQGADFSKATANAEMAQRAGSTTASAAEMFPQGSSVMRLADRARAATPDNALASLTEGRPGDIKALADEFLNRIRPSPVDPNVTANSAAGSANGVIQAAKEQRNTAIRNRMAAVQPVPPHDVRDIVDYLIRESNTLGITPSRRAAYREAASKFKDADGQLITNPQDLSLRLVEMQDAPKNPNFTGFQGQSVNAVDTAEALKNARDAISAFRPAFGQALDEFAAFSKGPIAKLKEGPIGTLSDRNPLQAGQTPISRLDGLLSGNSSPTVSGTARMLADPVMTGGNMTSATDIARALAQKKLHLGPTDPGNAIRGMEGSPAQSNFEALLRAGGNDARNTMEPLAVADRLQPFLKPAGNAEPPAMQMLQYLIRPLRSIDMATTGTSMTKMNTEIAKLLADGSPSSIKRLQEISMFDPNVRRMLSAKTAAIPLVQGE